MRPTNDALVGPGHFVWHNASPDQILVTCAKTYASVEIKWWAGRLPETRNCSASFSASQLRLRGYPVGWRILFVLNRILSGDISLRHFTSPLPANECCQILQKESYRERCFPNRRSNPLFDRDSDGTLRTTGSSRFAVAASKQRGLIMFVFCKLDCKQTSQTCKKSLANGCKELLVHLRPCSIAQYVRATCTM
jgi:hypothetical protein